MTKVSYDRMAATATVEYPQQHTRINPKTKHSPKKSHANDAADVDAPDILSK